MPVVKGRTSHKAAASPFRFRDGDALLRNVIENAAVPTFLSDLKGDVVYANRAFADLLGYEPEECLRLGMTTIVHPDDLALLRSQHSGVARGESFGHKAERRYLRKNGDVVWVLSSAASMPDAEGRPQFVSVQAVDIDRQKRAEAALAESERRWNFALESAGQGVWEADLVKHTIYHSRMWKIIRGFDPDQFVDTSEKAWLERVHPDDRERILDIIHRQDRGEIKREPFEYRERHRAGHYIWISSNGAAVEWAADGRPTRMIGTDTDVTRRKLAEGEKVELSRRLELALDVSQIGVYEENLATGEMFWDGRLHDIYGLPRGQGPLRGADWEAMLHPEDAAGATEAIALAIREKGTVKTKYRILKPDGEIRTIMSRGTYFEDDQSTPRFIGADWDITPEVALTESLRVAKQLAEARNVELEVAKARIENQSLHDALTGLPNRRYLDQVLSRHTGGNAGSTVALLHIDLDRFKQINDTLGHVAGDAMLIHVARLLKIEVGGQHFVARVGGDEFVIVCFNEPDTGRLATLADRIIARIRQPVPYEGHFCRFGASVGIAIAVGPDERLDVRRLMIDADVALHRAKGRGRNRHEFFSKALRDEIASTKRIADDILRGLEQHEFLPFYQPLFDANTLNVAGVEALVRWNHPAEGILSPVRFLKIAEDLNVLATIDRAILQQAMRDLDHWHGLGLDVPSVSVNVSFRRLSDDQLVPSLRELKIKPGTVSFEFLESIFLDEFDDVVAWNIDAIKEMGIGIDIDDFGTGHTSIVSLLKLKPRRFKIDRQLIDPIARIPEQRRLVASIIDIGKSLGIKVVAEGVETMEQAKILRELGCDMLQGYAFARPMPAAQLTNWLGAEGWRTAS